MAEVGWKITTIYLAKINVFLPIQVSIFVSQKSEILNIITKGFTKFCWIYVYHILLKPLYVLTSDRAHCAFKSMIKCLDYCLLNIFLYIRQ